MATRTPPVDPQGVGSAERSIAESTKPRADLSGEGAAHPCVGCRHYDRCTAEIICCEAFLIFAKFGADCSAERWSLAPRSPSAWIIERLLKGERRGF